MGKTLTTLLLSLFLLTACGTATPYQAADTMHKYGYSDQKIDDTNYIVSFSGNSLTDRKTVETYLFFRAAQLTLQQGYDYFIVAERKTDKNTRVTPVGLDPYFPGFYCDYFFYRPDMGWRYPSPFSPWNRYDPFWDGFYGPSNYYQTSTRYVAMAYITLGRGKKPSQSNAFDARQVEQNLRGKIVYPQP